MAKENKIETEINEIKGEPNKHLTERQRMEIQACLGSMSIKKTSKKSKERFFGLVWSEPLVMGMRAEGIVIAVNVVKNG